MKNNSSSFRLISVIVPVYNAEKYLARCISSVLGQNHAELELILVDDGSSDASGEICDTYAAHDPRVRVIHKANAGVSAARNDGIEAARGEFIAFLDNDDFYAPGMLARLLAICLENDCDIVQCRSVRGSADSLPTPPPGQVEILSGHRMLEDFYSCASIYVWDKLYRRRVWQGIRFPAGSYMHEDNAIIHRLYAAAGRVAVTKEPLYYHFRNPNSVVGSGFNERWGRDDPYADRIEYARDNSLPRLLAHTASRRVYHEGFLLSMNRRYSNDPASRRAFHAEHSTLMRRFYREALSTPDIPTRDKIMMPVRIYAPFLYHLWAWIKWRIVRHDPGVRFGEIK